MSTTLHESDGLMVIQLSGPRQGPSIDLPAPQFVEITTHDGQVRLGPEGACYVMTALLNYLSNVRPKELKGLPTYSGYIVAVIERKFKRPVSSEELEADVKWFFGGSYESAIFERALTNLLRDGAIERKAGRYSLPT